MSEHLSRHDAWASGAAYEPYVGRWSLRVAGEFLTWLGLSTGLRWLDVGCGTGALSRRILNQAAPSSVLGVDPSKEFLAYARETIQDERMQLKVGDAMKLPIQNGSCDAIVSGLVLNFISEPALAVTEMARCAKPGGVVAAYVWDYAGKMQFMRHFWNAAAALDPAANDLDEGRRFPVCQPEPLRALFEDAGLNAVEVRPIEIATDFQDFEDYWKPFLGGQGPAPGYVRSLDDERRLALRERLRAALPFALDGSIPMAARAWAVRGFRT